MTTASLPKEFFQGKELAVGSVCQVRIEKISGDNVQVTYVPHESEDQGPDANADFDEMSEDGMRY